MGVLGRLWRCFVGLFRVAGQVRPGAEPRLHHLHFAQRALPRQFFHAPIALVMTFMSGDGQRAAGAAMRALWLEAARDSGVEPLPADGLATHYSMLADFSSGTLSGAPVQICHVLMPPPRAAHEAHIVSAVYSVCERGSEPLKRYFALELDLSSGKPATVVAEWTTDGARIAHGPGPQPALAAFEAWIVAEVRRSGWPYRP
jgi:hypothetical protein